MTSDAPHLLPAMASTLPLDDTIRGVPPGTDAFDSSAVASRRWHPADGAMSLPVLTLDLGAFAANRDLFLRYARERQAAIAPHAKTPMAPDLARSLVEAGAWGTTVADIRQASVMLRAGLDRLIVANEVGGSGGANRLARLVAAWPHAEFYVFADSVPAVAALAEAWGRNPAIAPLGILVETGAARAGARTLAEAEAVADAVLAAGGRLSLAGVATYEGAAAQPDPQRSDDAVNGLLSLTGELFGRVRARVGPEAPLILSAGGSVFFDHVVKKLGPLVANDPASTLVLRSGAIYFHDHGVYDRALQTLDARRGFELDGAQISARSAFLPALRVWAEILSRPEPGLAICGMGMRDVSFDQGFPVPLAVWRGGHRRPIADGSAKIVKLNDQHAFLSVEADHDIAVGDVIEFGISHPCTCLDRYRVIFGLDATGHVSHAFPTFFG